MIIRTHSESLKKHVISKLEMTDQKPSEWIFLGPTRQRMSNELVHKALRASLAAADLRQGSGSMTSGTPSPVS